MDNTLYMKLVSVVNAINAMQVLRWYGTLP